ncbi:hypothetical protein [uncultured Cedecea sp.]|uniref:hypothetical protein n=1 Tax=uncultured Cedecea sp. TaxID=988762 RepID=UPI002622235A|nr:hypothetical protein [uncultured Cedecea sp.]
MFEPLRLSIPHLVQFDIYALIYPPQHQIHGYQVTCSSKQHIHPVKRDKAKASMTAKERSDLWKRFKNIDMEEYQKQVKAMQILDSNPPNVRFPRVDNDIPLLHSISVDHDIPRPHSSSDDYDIPRPHPIPVASNITQRHSLFPDYDIPRPHPIPVARNIKSV